MTEFPVYAELLNQGATDPADAKRFERRFMTLRVWLTTIALLCAGAAIASVTERIAPLTALDAAAAPSIMSQK